MILISDTLDFGTERLPTSRPLPILPALLLLTGALVGSYFVFPGFKERIDGAYALLSSGNTQALQAWVAWLGADFSRLRTFLLVATLVGLAALGGFIFFDQSRLCRKTNPGERDSA